MIAADTDKNIIILVCIFNHKHLLFILCLVKEHFLDICLLSVEYPSMLYKFLHK